VGEAYLFDVGVAEGVRFLGVVFDIVLKEAAGDVVQKVKHFEVFEHDLALSDGDF
jgi:hypothetical protein